MGDANVPRRLLFVVSNDFGELGTALALVKGQPFDSLVLLPDRLSQRNQALPVPSRSYRGLRDILNSVERTDRTSSFFCPGIFTPFMASSASMTCERCFRSSRPQVAPLPPVTRSWERWPGRTRKHSLATWR